MKKVPKDSVNDLIILLRFQKQKVMDIEFGCMTYSNIAKIVKKSYEYCRKVCCRYINSLPSGCCDEKLEPEDCDNDKMYRKFQKT